MKITVAEWRATGKGLTAGSNQIIEVDRESGTLSLKHEGWAAGGGSHGWADKFSRHDLPEIPAEVVKTASNFDLIAYILYGYTPEVNSALQSGVLREFSSVWPYSGRSGLLSLWGLV